MRKLLCLILIASIVTVPTYLIVTQIVWGSNFSNVMTTVTHNNEQYYIIPDSKLDDIQVIINNEGKKYYLLSEKKLRLLGPKLLTGEN